MRMRFGLFAAVTLLVLASSFAYAQTPQPTPSNGGREFFTLGGRNDHVYVYPEAHQATAQGVKDALNKAFAIYQPLFGAKSGQTTAVPFQIVVFRDTNPAHQEPDVLAGTAYRSKEIALLLLEDIYPLGPILDDSVCMIRVYNLWEANLALAASTLAHEFAHCYQNYYQPLSIGNFTVSKWWVEGTAEWLAWLVYPNQFPRMISLNFRYDRSTLIRQYTNLYFWAWVAGPDALGSNQAVIDFILNLPQDTERYPEMLQNIHGSDIEFNHKWMLALYERRVPMNPNLALAGTVYENASAGTVRLSTVRYAGDHAVIRGIKIDPGSRAVVTLSAAAENKYGVSIKHGGRWMRIQDGSPVDFCPEGGQLDVLFSRGNAASATDTTPLTLTFTQDPAPSNPPCEATATPAPPNCVIGTWVVTKFPVSTLLAGLGQVDSSNYIYSFAANGTFTGAYDIVGLFEEEGTIVLHYPFQGTYSFTRQHDFPTIYNVNAMELRFIEGGSASLTTKKGQTSDLTKVYYDAFATYGTSAFNPEGELSCEGNEIRWVSNQGYEWVLLRLVR